MVETRLWRPAAQRSVRNAWGFIQGHRTSWATASAAVLSAATSLVNAHLLHGDIDAMELGVLSDIEGIKGKAKIKLLSNQRTHLRRFLAHYDDLVQSVVQMTRESLSMRTYLKSSGSGPLVEFTNQATIVGDTGDGGGVPVYSTLPLAVLELLAKEVAIMYQRELKIKWLLALEFCKLVYPDWESEQRERDLSLPYSDLSMEFNSSTSAPLVPEMQGPDDGGEISRIKNHEPKSSVGDSLQIVPDEEVVALSKAQDRHSTPPSRDTLQVYLTALLAEVHINKDRIEEIFRLVNEEMTVGLFGSP